MLSEPDKSFHLTDWRIYTAQLRKILLSTLYYLEVQADSQILYKIGVTTRPIALAPYRNQARPAIAL